MNKQVKDIHNCGVLRELFYLATVFPQSIPHPQLIPQCGII